MKRLLTIATMLCFALSTPVFAEVGDFDSVDATIVKKTINKVKISSIEIDAIGKSATVYIVYGYMDNGKFVSLDEYKHMRVEGVKYRQLMGLLSINTTKIPQIIQAVIDSE